MTVPLTQQTIPVKDVAAVRKRRRRAPAGGAADDCFTCSKKNIKCDRRRPYCSQCLEVGKECSGYKTQLTWGVGVASRGKLRGLSLPIAKAPPVSREPKRSPTRSRAGSGATAVQWVEQDEARRIPRGPIDIPAVTHAASAPATPYPVTGFDYMSMSHQENTAPVPQQSSWGAVAYSPELVHSPETTHKYPKFNLPLVTEGLSSSIDTVSEADYLSPMSQSYSRDDVPYTNSPTLMYENYTAGSQTSPGPHSPPHSIIIDQPRTAPTSCPSLVYAPSEPSSSLHSHMDVFESQLSQKLMRECDSLSATEADVFSTGNAWPSSQHHSDEDIQSRHSDQAGAQWPVSEEPQCLRVSQDLVSKMPFFVDYYKNIMCPSMVYIDGPHNPYRDHILQLAGGSPSLQHAICALAACNLRMKRRLSLGQHTRELSEKLLAEKHAAETMADAQPDDQSLSEEYQHRNLAVHLLNQQLNDPMKSTNDSVLATILLLCHYRMVESGVAKFHTQFAGIKKILALRAKQFTPSTEAAWMEALFNYFDAISASINDREAQLNSTFGTSSDVQALPAGAENLVGCDRELFKSISKLGRLNLLSQHRPVRNLVTSPVHRHASSRAQSPLSAPLGHGFKDSIHSIHRQGLGDLYNLSTQRFDGNGFGTTLDEDEILASTVYSSVAYDDHRSTFWREWKEARLALQSWQFDASRVAASLPGPPTPAQVRDLGSLSEAFRYAALLYTERLASPSLPSSHNNFQNLVSQVVYYATSLETGSTAEKFLLWPLFVAGSECVNELQQNIVRSKCHDIMARSGYMNNLAALDVLETLWVGDWKDPEPRSPRSQVMAARRGPFSWTKCIGGPGVEVEWIMF